MLGRQVRPLGPRARPPPPARFGRNEDRG
jgi:hypothetical protein